MMDLAELLRAGCNTTVGTLASQLGVSERSVRRDLAALRDRGLRIDADPGPGGGVRLRERGVAAMQLTLNEVITLWLSCGLSQSTVDLPWSHLADSALSKLLASLPPSRAQALRTMCRRVVVGRPASTRTRDGVGSGSKEVGTVFEEAFERSVALNFHYTDREGRLSVRRVEPHGLLVQAPVWYVLGRDVDKAAPRMFRMDRITQPRVVSTLGFRPDVAVITEQLNPECSWRPLFGTL